NALRHAGPGTHARVLVRYAPDAVEIEVADDGRGPAPDAAGGHGLVGMRERATLTGGTFDAGERGGGGFVVRASLPTSAPDAGPAVEPAR
ncbi:MAG TPA: ATP-binding protein, partial [Actinomycetota bacterium]